MRNGKRIVTISIAAAMILSSAVLFAQGSGQGQKDTDSCTEVCCASQPAKTCPSCCAPGGWVNASTSCGSGCATMAFGRFCFSGNSPWKDLNYNAQGKLMDPLNKNQVQEMAEYFVKWMGNTRLTVGKLVEKEDSFVVSLITKDKSLVENIKIDKESVCVSREL